MLSSPKFLGKGQPESQATAETARARRGRIRAETPQTWLNPAHLAGAVLLPSRQELLARLQTGGVAAEIGVSKGDFTADILSIARPKKLHLVDVWEGDRYGPDLEIVTTRFTGELADGMLEINRGYSTDVLGTFDDGYFDWVYIDTNHSYRTTAKELELSAQKVRKDGRIAGHDFCSGNPVAPVVYGVIEACFEFCLRENWKIEYLSLDPDTHFSFCLRKMQTQREFS